MANLIFSHINPYYNMDTDALTWIGNIFFGDNGDKAIFSDKYGYLNRYSKWKMDKLIKPLPNAIMLGTRQEFESILLEELETLRNKQFALMYSGGVDSTTILVSLLKLGIDEFTLVYSDNSIEEYPLMWELLKQYPKIRYEKIDKYNYRNKCNSIMAEMPLMTGDHADNYFTSNFRCYWNAFSFDNWKDFMKTKADSNVIDMLDESFKFYNVNIITPVQLFYWLSFSITNQFGNPFLLLQSLPNRKNFYCPYLNKKFLDWGFSRLDLITNCGTNDGALNYKVEMKEIIREFTKDNDYFSTKTKVRSIRKMVQENRVGFFIVDSDRVYNFEEKLSNRFRTNKMIMILNQYRLEK